MRAALRATGAAAWWMIVQHVVVIAGSHRLDRSGRVSFLEQNIQPEMENSLDADQN
jgi:hypothetical protein